MSTLKQRLPPVCDILTCLFLECFHFSMPSSRGFHQINVVFIVTSALHFSFSVPAITIAGSTVITSIVGTAGLVALPTMAAGTLAPGTLAPGVMSTSIAAQPIMTASTALLAGKAFLVVVQYIRCLPSCSLTMSCVCFACWAAYSAEIKFYSFHL